MRRFWMVMLFLAASCGEKPVPRDRRLIEEVVPLDETLGHLCEQYRPREPDWVEQEDGSVVFEFWEVEVAEVSAGDPDTSVTGVLGDNHCPDDGNYYFFEDLEVDNTVFRSFTSEGFEDSLDCFVFDPGDLQTRTSYMEREQVDGALYFEQPQYVFWQETSRDFSGDVTELHESGNHEVGCGFETVPTAAEVTLYFVNCNDLLVVTDTEELTVVVGGDVTEDNWECRTVAYDGVTTASAHTPLLLPRDDNAEVVFLPCIIGILCE